MIGRLLGAAGELASMAGQLAVQNASKDSPILVLKSVLVDDRTHLEKANK